MELSLLDIISILSRRIWILILSTILGLSGALLISVFLITPKYSASAQLYVNPNRDNMENTGNLNELQYSQRLVNSYLIILKNDSFLENVSKEVDLGYSPSQIRSMLSLSSINNTEIFEVKIDSNSPQDSYKLVSAIIDLAPSEITRIRPADSVRLVSAAKVPSSPSSPNKPLNTAIGAILGLMIAVGLVLLIEMLDLRVKTEDELVEKFGIPVIGSIPNIEENK